MDMEDIKLKHCHITKHPLRECYMVINDSFPYIVPYTGTLEQCKKAAEHANQSAEDLLNRMIAEAKKEGHSASSIKKAVNEILNRK